MGGHDYADMYPPVEGEHPPNETKGPLFLGTVWSLWAVTIIIYAIRMGARPEKKLALTAADYTITVALIAKTISVALMTVAISHGFGRHNAYITYRDHGIIARYNVGVYMTNVLASGLARISIACMLLTLTTTRAVRAILWATIALQVMAVLGFEITQFVQCDWLITGVKGGEKKNCLPQSSLWATTFMTFITSMVSDLTCAVLPFFILRDLSRPTVEKTLIYILMASCLVATGFGIPKIYHVVVFDFTSEDFLWDTLHVYFWCRMEEGIIIIAACAPLLKGPIERFLKRMGVKTFENPVRELKSIDWAAVGGSANDGPAQKVREQEKDCGSSGASRSWNGSGSTLPDLEAARSNHQARLRDSSD